MSSVIETESVDITYKLLLLGDSGVGKTSLIRNLTGAKFSHTMLTTVGIDFVKVTVNVDGARVRLQIWDTAGQERFKSITRFQYRSTKGLLLVYDVTNRESFETLSFWMDSIDKDFDQTNNEPIPVLIVGNKCDLVCERQVSTQEGQTLADKNYAAGFCETSALDGTNVRACFEKLAHAVTEVYNPGLMGIYRHSAAIDQAKLNGGPHPTRKDTIDGKRPGSIKLSKKSARKKKTCECSS